jgi:hypothetical protein
VGNPQRTNSTPFVTFDAATQETRVYFQGTDNRLLKINSDGSNGFQIGKNTTDSAPFVFRDPVDGTEWVYFRGHRDDRLWKVRADPDGTGLTQIGHNTTNSTPFVTFDASTNEVWVYFQGTDDSQPLWKVRNDAAGTGLTQIGGNSTAASPFVSDDGWVYFQGTDNRLLTVFNDGTMGSQLGSNNTASTPKTGAVQFVGGQLSRWVYFQEADTNNLMRYLQTENALATGTARPKYYILTVLYAPPGTTGGNKSAGPSNSLVDYGSSSTTGTTTTIASSVKAGFNLQIGPSKDEGLQFGFSQNTTDSSSILIQKAVTFDIKIPGPATDGIDHNHDVFALLLNPLLMVSEFPGNNVQVAMGVDGPTMNIQYVYAGWLNGAQAMAPGVLSQLEAAGLDDEDYQQILSTNPFQSGSAVDTDRFIALPESFAYEPPYSATDAPWVATYTVQNTTTSTNTVTVEYDVTLSASDPIIDKILTVGDSVTWTNTNTTTTTDTTMESATVTVGGPSFGYPNTSPSTSGPTSILVYWDSVYHSYAFVFPAGEVPLGNPVTAQKKRGAKEARKPIKKPTRTRRRAG